MSTEKYIEELLFEAAKNNNRTIVLQISKKLREENPKLSVYESIELAYNEINSTIKSNG